MTSTASTSGATSAHSSEWPAVASGYELVEEIGEGGSACVYHGKCKTHDVAIKIVDLENTKISLDVLRKEIVTLGQSSHPNVVAFYTSFLVEDKLWLVMDYMAGGSVLDIMKWRFPKGLEESLCATILREALKGIAYFHHSGSIHRDVKSANILISATGDVRLADLGVAASLILDGERKSSTKTYVGTPCYMSPEVLESTGHSYSADIWSFGITALELARGDVPFSQYAPMKVVVLVLKNPPPTFDDDEMRLRGWSKSFKDLVDQCLHKDPTKRPTSQKLLEHKFFKSAKKPDAIVAALLHDLPSLGTRFAARKKNNAKVKQIQQPAPAASGAASAAATGASASAAASSSASTAAASTAASANPLHVSNKSGVDTPDDDLASDDGIEWDFGDDPEKELAVIGVKVDVDIPVVAVKKKTSKSAVKSAAAPAGGSDVPSKRETKASFRDESALIVSDVAVPKREKKQSFRDDLTDEVVVASDNATRASSKTKTRKADAAAAASAESAASALTSSAASAVAASDGADANVVIVKAEKKKRTDCPNCAAMREQVAALEARIKVLESQARAHK
jgi:serine/threonine-protein kinase OSR1/STK39